MLQHLCLSLWQWCEPHPSSSAGCTALAALVRLAQAYGLKHDWSPPSQPPKLAPGRRSFREPSAHGARVGACGSARGMAPPGAEPPPPMPPPAPATHGAFSSSASDERPRPPAAQGAGVSAICALVSDGNRGAMVPPGATAALGAGGGTGGRPLPGLPASVDLLAMESRS